MKKFILVITGLLIFNINTFAFNDGFVLGMKAYFSGSTTSPHISDEELKIMGAEYMKGSTGFIVHGGVDVTYIFDSKKYFKMESNKIFGGLGLGGYIELGQGFSGQVSGQGPVDIFVNVFFTPVVHFGTTLKTYLLSNRLVLGFGLGCRMIADPTPMYDMYSTEPNTIHPEVGTMIITKEMMKKMNPLGAEFKGSMEYVQPVLPTTELVIGGYLAYTVYKPGYVSMPPTLADAAKKASGFDAHNTKLKSFYVNSLDFGVSMGLNFKVNP